MNRKRHIAIGPGAASLILIMVTLAMSVLAALTLISARNEHQLSLRSIEITQANHSLYDRSERTLASLSALVNGEEGWKKMLPAGVGLKEDTLFWRETDGTRSLQCAAVITETNGKKILQWQIHRLSGETEVLWD